MQISCKNRLTHSDVNAILNNDHKDRVSTTVDGDEDEDVRGKQIGCRRLRGQVTSLSFDKLCIRAGYC